MREPSNSSAWEVLTKAAREPGAVWVRLPPAPVRAVAKMAEASAVALWPLAVEPLGRRASDAPLVDDAALEVLRRAQDGGHALIPVLDHAGPEAGRFSSERPIGPAAVPAPTSGRAPLPLDDAGWERVMERYRAAAARLKAGGIGRAILSVDDDGLLAASLSPRANPGRPFAERLTPALRAARAVLAEGLEVGVALTVEELSPAGLDATDGIEAARALVDVGAGVLVASGGSEALPVLKHRSGARGPDDVWLASAAWLVGRVAVPVLAQGPCPDPERARAAALALGLDGVVAVPAREEAP